jgi:hypothetical protein
MSFAPVKPEVHHPPLKVADDTWLIQQMQEAAIGPLWVYLHSLVIKGKEPIIVDTGTPANREQWLADVFSIVDPATCAGSSSRTTTWTTRGTWSR